MNATSSTHAIGRNALSGMALAAASFAFLSGSDVIFKLLATGGHPAYQIIFVNGCFAMLPILVWAATTGGLRRLATNRLPQHLARGSMSVFSAFAGIYAYSRLPLTDYYAIVFAGPLIIAIMGAFWLGEKIETARWYAILIGFCGVLVVVNPLNSPLFKSQPLDAHQSIAMLGRFAAFVSIFCYSLSVITIRRMRDKETNASFAFYGYLSALIICGVLSGTHNLPDLTYRDIAHLALSGTLGGLSSICMMTAYHRTPVALVAPFQYTQIIWGALAGFLIWQHVPSHHLMLGAAIVAVSGIYVIYREMREKTPHL